MFHIDNRFFADVAIFLNGVGDLKLPCRVTFGSGTAVDLVDETLDSLILPLGEEVCSLPAEV